MRDGAAVEYRARSAVVRQSRARLHPHLVGGGPARATRAPLSKPGDGPVRGSCHDSAQRQGRIGHRPHRRDLAPRPRKLFRRAGAPPCSGDRPRDADLNGPRYSPEVPGGRYSSVDVLRSGGRCTKAGVADCIAEFGAPRHPGQHHRLPTRCAHTPTMTDEEWNRGPRRQTSTGRFTCAVAALPALVGGVAGQTLSTSRPSRVWRARFYSAGVLARPSTELVGTDPRVGHRVHEGEAPRQRGVPRRAMPTAQSTEFHPSPTTPTGDLIMRHRIAPRIHGDGRRGQGRSRSWPATTRRPFMARSTRVDNGKGAD